MISRLVGIYYNMYSGPNYARFSSYRPEHKKLRTYLEKNKQPVCIICQQNLPPYILECAHIKPRTICNDTERLDIGVVNWMCRNCHKIYDKGDIGVFNGRLFKSNLLGNYDLDFNFKEEEYLRSEEYFKYQFKNIFKNE